ncbi:RNA-binding domain-containing protein [Jaminaea rosea]|uniref:RNA-binding domain-containing protein n=1 Tax=Jaminaea rosea TaxID=1569628 RepID=A0A316UHH3_9BASI|nr:RNA-binding domain-containing protein [Jaminaea rosea]PWN24712.1 RNA-binding domain-containing protein [Jaminaea rosea]
MPTPPSSASSTRLFVGNLHPSVSDYDLVQLFQPYGHLTKLDVVFHRSGPLRGKPKGFAFVEFSKREDSLRAKVELDGKPFKAGRTLSVNFANQVDEATGGGTGKAVRRRHDDDELRPTTLSLVKNARQVKGGADAKIAAMEAKLAALRQKKAGGGGEAEESSPKSSSSSALKRAPASAGLPVKPPPSSSSSTPPR